MTTLLSIINALIFILLGAIHFYWGIGGKWGSIQALPQNLSNGTPLFLPSIVACFAVALGLWAMAIVTLNQVGLMHLNLPNIFNQYCLYVIGSIFLLRAIGDFKYVGFFKSIKNTEFGRMDMQFYSPLCLYLGITSLLIKILN